MKKTVLENLQYSQAEYWESFKNTYFEEHLVTAASGILKQLQNSGVSSVNLWTGCEQLSY